MPMLEITDEEIQPGEPVSAETAGKIKNNLEELEDRVTGLEGGSATIYPPIIMRVGGTYGEPGDLAIPAANLLKTTLNFNLTITGVRILIDKAGISGNTEIDLKYKRGAAVYKSIFTTKPMIAAAAGDDATSESGVLNVSEVTLQAGDILALSITEAQLRASGVMIRIDYVKN